MTLRTCLTRWDGRKVKNETQLVVPVDDWIAALNNAARLREQLEKSNQIVRRIATSKSVQELLDIASDAEKVWAEMKGTGDERA